MQVVMKNVGMRKAMKVMTFVAAWEMARRDWSTNHPGEVFTIEDYADWWKESRSTAFREQALFRKAVADRWSTPGELLAEAQSQRAGDWASMKWAGA